MSLVTGIEVVWSVIAGVGVTVQLWLLRDAIRSGREIHVITDDPRGHRLADGHVRAAETLLFVHATFLYAGLRALWMPNQPLTLGRAVTIVLFCTAAVWLVRMGFKDRGDRIFVRTYQPV